MPPAEDRGGGTPDANKQPTQPKNRKEKTEVARDQPHLLRKGEILQNVFEVEEQFGGGGFGQIYKINHREFHQKMALKIEPAKTDVRRAKLEMTIMLSLRGKPSIPILYGCGKIRGSPYIVMQMLGRNLSDLRRRQPDRCLSDKTVFRISMHIVGALKVLHDMGYCHRDVKPSNCCMGSGSNKRIAHLIDFGMVRRIRDMEGKLRPPRKLAPFRGTIRYISLAMHNRKEVGFGDDLIGWLYAMVELLNGRLPWSTFEKIADILKSKTETPIKFLCAHSKGLLKFAELVINLKYEQIPDYEKLINTLKSSLPPDVVQSTPYDWEITATKIYISKRIMERSVMASVGTELRPTIVAYPETKKLRTPSRTRNKKVGMPSPSPLQQPTSIKNQPKLDMPPDPQKTLDVDEHLDVVPVKQKTVTKSKEKSMVATPKENAKEQKAEKETKKLLPPPILPSDDEKTQCSSDN